MHSHNVLFLRRIFHAMLLIPALLFSFQFLYAQEAYKGPYKDPEVFKIGDLVEATYAGTWTAAEVVGINDREGKYRIHFEGEKYCNGHVLDSELLKEYVRPRKKLMEDKPAGDQPDLDDPLPGDPEMNVLPVDGEMPQAPVVGDKVWYADGTVIWNKDGVIEKYDPQTRSYTVRTESGSGTIVPCYMVMKPGSTPDNKFFIGLWDVYVNGAAYTTTNNNEQTQHFSGGMRQAPLQIKEDGSYTWYSPDKKTIQGIWKPREDVPGIVLSAGVDGLDWTLYQKTEGYAPHSKTRDEIGFHHMETQSGYLIAYRVGPNQSCVLVNREF